MLGGRDVCARIYDLKFYRRRRRDPLNRLFRNLHTITQQNHYKWMRIGEHKGGIYRRT